MSNHDRWEKIRVQRSSRQERRVVLRSCNTSALPNDEIPRDTVFPAVPYAPLLCAGCAVLFLALTCAGLGQLLLSMSFRRRRVKTEDGPEMGRRDGGTRAISAQ